MTLRSALVSKTQIFTALLWVALIGILFKDLYSLWTCTRTLVFHEDEYQHMHLAWNTLRGKIIYRDFEDTHGPLSTLLYSFLLKLKPGLVEDISSLYTLRYWNLLAMLMTSGLLALSVLHLTQKKLLAGVALLVYFSSPGIKSVAFRIRPDCYVALFSVLSLYLGLKQRPLLMGISLGLALGFHPKFFPIAMGVLAVMLVLGVKRRASFGRVLSGLVLVLTAIGVWFWYHRSLSFLVDSTWVSNFRGAYQRLFIEQKMAQFLFSASRTERWLGVLVAVLLVLFLIQFLRERKVSWTFDWVLASAYSFLGLLFVLAPVWAHALTFVIPTALPFLVATLVYWTKLERPLICLVVFLCGTLSFSSLEKLDHTKELQPVQFESLALTLKEVKRSEPIFYIWTSRCPAYIFNEDPSREWMAPFRRAVGDPIRMLPPINTLSFHPMFMRLLDSEEQAYIKNHFKVDGCLWRRRETL